MHIDTERTWRGGERQVVSLMERLPQHGYEPHLAAPGGSVIGKTCSGRFPVLTAGMRNNLDWLSAAKIARWTAREGIDLMHAHTSRAHSLAALAKRLPGGDVPLVVSRRVEFPVRGGWFGRRKYHLAAHYIPISEAIARRLREGGIEPGRITMIHSGLEFNRFRQPDPDRARLELNIPAGAPVLGNIAFCERRKRQADLILAMPYVLRAHPETRLIIVGDGEERGRLAALAREMNLEDRVLFPGFREDLENFYALFDVFLMVSEREGLCNSILEAYFFRRPVIAARAGGMPEIVEHGETGILIEPGRPDAIADAAVRLLGDPDLRRRMGGAGRVRVLERFNVDAMARGTARVYGRILSPEYHTHE